MKLVTFRTGEHVHIGAIDPVKGSIADFTVSDPAPHFASMLALIQGGGSALDHAREVERAPKAVRGLNEVTLLAALPRPEQMRDFMGYEKHIRQARAHRYLFGEGNRKLDPSEVALPPVWYEQPLYYKCNRFSIAGPDTDVLWPSYAKLLDYELELGVVIGKGGRNIAPESAFEHVFGYIIFNDVSARDAQIHEMQGGLGPAKGKDFDTANVLGPWLVTRDEIPDPYDLVMTASVNGVERARANSGEIYHRIEDMIAHVSREETLHPGEFFGLGTVGDGCGLEHGSFLEPGDEVELSIAGLGILRNRIGQRAETRSGS